MPHNIHNVLSDVYDLLRMNGTSVVHTWTIERDANQNQTGLLVFRLDRDRCLSVIPHCVRFPVQVCEVRVSQRPNQMWLVEKNTLFHAHDFVQLMDLLTNREIEF